MYILWTGFYASDSGLLSFKEINRVKLGEPKEEVSC